MNDTMNTSGYENAPSTQLLATQCAACGRPLVDAVSVETGMGPECRRKYGYGDANAEGRAEANALVYAVAVNQTGLLVAQAAERLKALGFDKLASKIVDRAVDITITEEGGTLAVEFPYNEGAIRDCRRIPGRRWDADRKVNTFPVSARAHVWRLLQFYFLGAVGQGPRGPFQVTR